MRNFRILFTLVFSLALVAPSFATNNTLVAKEITTIPTEKEVPAEVRTMLNRLEEIKEIDKSTLSRIEKKELRKEVRTIKKTLRSSGNGVYLSIGAIILIVLLLILLL